MAGLLNTSIHSVQPETQTELKWAKVKQKESPGFFFVSRRAKTTTKEDIPWTCPNPENLSRAIRHSFQRRNQLRRQSRIPLSNLPLKNSSCQLWSVHLKHLGAHQLPHLVDKLLPQFVGTSARLAIRHLKPLILQRPQRGKYSAEHHLRLRPLRPVRYDLIFDDSFVRLQIRQDQSADDVRPTDGLEADDGTVVRPERLVGVEEVLETGARETRFERVRGFGVLFRDLADERGGEVAESEVRERVGAGPETAANEAG